MSVHGCNEFWDTIEPTFWMIPNPGTNISKCQYLKKPHQNSVLSSLRGNHSITPFRIYFHTTIIALNQVKRFIFFIFKSSFTRRKARLLLLSIYEPFKVVVFDQRRPNLYIQRKIAGGFLRQPTSLYMYVCYERIGLTLKLLCNLIVTFRCEVYRIQLLRCTDIDLHVLLHCTTLKLNTDTLILLKFVHGYDVRHML